MVNSCQRYIQGTYKYRLLDIFYHSGYTKIWENIGLLTNEFPTLKFRKRIRKHFVRQWKNDTYLKSGLDKKLQT